MRAGRILGPARPPQLISINPKPKHPADPPAHPPGDLLAVVGGSDEAHRLVREAGLRLLPAARFFSAPDVAVATGELKRASGGVLVLIEPEPGSLEPAASPWPVLRLGTADSASDSAYGWTVPLIAHAMEASMREHRLVMELNRARGDLLTLGRRVVHDLRTPLGGILSGVEVLQEIVGEVDPSCLDFTRSIAESVNDMSRLLDRVAFVAKASAMPVPVPVTAVSMDEAVGNSLDRLNSTVVERGAVVSQPDGWPEAGGVPAWVEMIWQNLILNALRHGPERPRIGLEWEEQGEFYCFKVTDNGPAIPRERLGLLFQPFETLHQPGTARGFGLSIVRRLVELQGGACQYEYSPEIGNIFKFTLKKVRAV